MGFFSDITKKTSEATGKIARETKLKLKISENKNKIEEIYEEIGKKVYEKHIREQSIDINTDLKEECSKIDALSEEIESARLEILELNKKTLCKKCATEVEKEATFCPKCGERLSEEPTKKEEAVQKLEEADIKPENEEKAEAVKENLKEEIKEE